MKSIKDLRESYNLITEKEEHDMNKLTQLVRAGLFDAKKLSALKRAMDKPADKMTAQEKRMMINLLDALMAEVLSDKQVYRKIKQDVMKEAVTVDTKDYLTKMDPRVKRYGYSQKDAPSVLLLKRKAIRVFPDGEKVALYYAQAIDKYVSIPFSEIGINENWITTALRGVRDYLTRDDSSNNTNNTNKEEDPIAKELKPLSREKTRLKISTDDEIKNKPYTTGIEARRQKAERDANAVMAKGVRESFKSKLQSLDEDVFDYETRAYEMLGQQVPRLGSFGGVGGGAKTGRLSPASKVRIDTPSNINTRTGKVEFFPSGSAATATKIKPSGPPKRFVPKRKSPDRRREKPFEDPRTVPQRKPSGPPTRKPVEQPKPQKPVEQPKPEPLKPKPSRFNPPKVEPDVKPNVKPTTPANVPEVKPDKKTFPAVKPGNRPDVGPTQQPASQPASKPAARPEVPGALPAAKPATKPAEKLGNRPDIGPTQQPASQPVTRTRQEQKPKQAEQRASGPRNRQRLKDRKDKDRRPFALPAFDVGATALASMTPGATKLNVSGPRREGGTDAIRSRMASNERKAWQAQASMRESVEINLDGNQFVLNNEEANKVLSLYESLNVKNKKKMVKMMNESEEQLNKIVSFAVRQ